VAVRLAAAKARLFAATNAGARLDGYAGTEPATAERKDCQCGGRGDVQTAQHAKGDSQKAADGKADAQNRVTDYRAHAAVSHSRALCAAPSGAATGCLFRGARVRVGHSARGLP